MAKEKRLRTRRSRPESYWRPYGGLQPVLSDWLIKNISSKYKQARTDLAYFAFHADK